MGWAYREQNDAAGLANDKSDTNHGRRTFIFKYRAVWYCSRPEPNGRSGKVLIQRFRVEHFICGVDHFAIPTRKHIHFGKGTYCRCIDDTWTLMT